MLVFLTGFMCCGKTTDGKAAAALLNIPFLDLDAELERFSGMPIWSFIEQKGIAEFRQLETEVLLKTRQFLSAQLCENHLPSNNPEAIIATGGGSVLLRENRDFLLQPEHSIIWLDLPFSLLLERIRVAQRPLLSGLSDEKIHQVYLERLPFYQSTSTHCINNTPVSKQIFSLFQITS